MESSHDPKEPTGEADLAFLFDMLTHPLNLAHFEDRKAEKFLRRDETNYQAAIECHQRAHGHLRTVQLNIKPKDMHRLEDANKAIIDSVYAQMDRHMIQQSILLHRQRKAIIELKRQPYIASIQERATELAIVDALTHKEKLQQQLSEHDLLLESLKERIDREEKESREKLKRALESRLSQEGNVDEGEANPQIRMSELEEKSQHEEERGLGDGDLVEKLRDAEPKTNPKNPTDLEKSSNLEKMHDSEKYVGDDITGKISSLRDVPADGVSAQGDILEQLAETSEKELEVPSSEIGEEGSESIGTKKPKSLQETFEELKNVNDQFKKLVDDLVSENMRLKEELEAQHQYIIQQKFFTVKDVSLDAGDMAESNTSVDNPIYSLPKALDIAPLEQVHFDIPDEELKCLDDTDVTLASSPTRNSKLMDLVERTPSPKC